MQQAVQLADVLRADAQHAGKARFIAPKATQLRDEQVAAFAFRELHPEDRGAACAPALGKRSKPSPCCIWTRAPRAASPRPHRARPLT